MDWEPGDLAFCVKDSDDGPLFIATSWRVQVGAVYTVSAVVIGPDDETGLWLAEDADPRADACWRASWFVKVTPGQKIAGSEVDQKNPWKVPA